MNAPQLDFAAIAPIAFTGFGALVVLLGEVWLSRRKTFLGRAVTEVWIGTVLAMVAAVFLGLAIYAAGAYDSCHEFVATGAVTGDFFAQH